MVILIEFSSPKLIFQLFLAAHKLFWSHSRSYFVCTNNINKCSTGGYETMKKKDIKGGTKWNWKLNYWIWSIIEVKNSRVVLHAQYRHTICAQYVFFLHFMTHNKRCETLITFICARQVKLHVFKLSASTAMNEDWMAKDDRPRSVERTEATKRLCSNEKKNNVRRSLFTAFLISSFFFFFCSPIYSSLRRISYL